MLPCGWLVGWLVGGMGMGIALLWCHLFHVIHFSSSVPAAVSRYVALYIPKSVQSGQVVYRV